MPRRRIVRISRDRSAALGHAQERQAQEDRHHQIVGDHRAERHGGDDDHRRRRREAAQIGDQRQPPLPRGDRQQQHVQIALADPGDPSGDRDRQDEQVDRQQVGRKQPARRRQMRLVDVLDHGHLELPVEKQEGEARHGGDQEPVRIARGAAGHRQGWAVGQPGGLTEQVGEAVEHDVGDVDADDQEGRELDHALERDRKDHALVVLRGVDVASAEQDAEQSQQQQDQQRRLGTAGARDRLGRRADQRRDAGSHRLELESDIRNRSHDRYDGDQARERGALAVAGCDEVRDRRDALRLGDAQHLLDQEAQQQGRQGRSEIDRQEIQPLPGGQPDAAVEGPGGAVDAQRQRVDIGAADQAAPLVGASIAIRCDREQHA